MKKALIPCVLVLGCAMSNRINAGQGGSKPVADAGQAQSSGSGQLSGSSMLRAINDGAANFVGVGATGASQSTGSSTAVNDAFDILQKAPGEVFNATSQVLRLMAAVVNTTGTDQGTLTRPVTLETARVNEDEINSMSLGALTNFVLDLSLMPEKTFEKLQDENPGRYKQYLNCEEELANIVQDKKDYAEYLTIKDTDAFKAYMPFYRGFFKEKLTSRHKGKERETLQGARRFNQFTQNKAVFAEFTNNRNEFIKYQREAAYRAYEDNREAIQEYLRNKALISDLRGSAEFRSYLDQWAKDIEAARRV